MALLAATEGRDCASATVAWHAGDDGEGRCEKTPFSALHHVGRRGSANGITASAVHGVEITVTSVCWEQLKSSSAMRPPPKPSRSTDSVSPLQGTELKAGASALRSCGCVVADALVESLLDLGRAPRPPPLPRCR